MKRGIKGKAVPNLLSPNSHEFISGRKMKKLYQGFEKKLQYLIIEKMSVRMMHRHAITEKRKITSFETSVQREEKEESTARKNSFHVVFFNCVLLSISSFFHLVAKENVFHKKRTQR